MGLKLLMHADQVAFAGCVQSQNVGAVAFCELGTFPMRDIVVARAKNTFDRAARDPKRLGDRACAMSLLTKSQNRRSSRRVQHVLTPARNVV